MPSWQTRDEAPSSTLAANRACRGLAPVAAFGHKQLLATGGLAVVRCAADGYCGANLVGFGRQLATHHIRRTSAAGSTTNRTCSWPPYCLTKARARSASPASMSAHNCACGWPKCIATPQGRGALGR